MHGLFLTHAVGAGNSLFEDGRVPGQVEVDDGVGRLQIQARRTGVGGDEQPTVGVRLKLIHQSLPLLLRHGAVESHVFEL